MNSLMQPLLMQALLMQPLLMQPLLMQPLLMQPLLTTGHHWSNLRSHHHQSTSLEQPPSKVSSLSMTASLVFLDLVFS